MRGRRVGAPLAAFLSLASAAVVAAETSLPPAVIACTHENDVLRRLACFDREVGRYTAPTPAASATVPTVPAAPAVQREAPAKPAPTPASAAVPAETTTTGTGEAPRPGIRSQLKALTGEGAAARDAHIAGLENGSGGLLVIHLDNGETWEQLQGIAGDRGLRAGDAVRLEKHFGSWYLSGPHLTHMHVREK